MLPRDQLVARRERRLRRGLAGAEDLHGRRDRKDQRLERRLELAGVARAAHPRDAEHRVAVPVERRGLVARVEEAQDTVEAREGAQVGELARLGRGRVDRARVAAAGDGEGEDEEGGRRDMPRMGA